MCYFITLVVRGSDGTTIDECLREHGRRAMPINNASVAGVLAAGEMQFLTTVGHCDCGTALARPALDRTGKRADQAAKLAKRGWSRAKIARWIGDRAKADDRADARRHASSPDSIELWSRIIADVAATPGVEQAGLLLHFYAGSVEDETFELTRETVRVGDFESRLRDLPEDQLLMATT